MIYEINDTFPSRRYKGETIGEVLQKDSGYIKDLIMKSNDFSISDECMAEAIQITKGLRDAWKKPENPKNCFDGLKNIEYLMAMTSMMLRFKKRTSKIEGNL